VRKSEESREDDKEKPLGFISQKKRGTTEYPEYTEGKREWRLLGGREVRGIHHFSAWVL